MNSNNTFGQRFGVGHFALIIGVLIVFSGAIVNPWVGQYVRASVTNYRDVMYYYFLTSIILGLLITVVGILVLKFRYSLLENISLFLITLCLIVLFDRLLLAKFGLPLWKADIENQYVHRPNVVRLWGQRYDYRPIVINRYGHHDNDFELKKGPLEFRGLILGDSIAMGHGVSRDATFSNQLEKLLRNRNSHYKSFQIINAGVQGYSTYQEYNILKRSLVFDPDFIVVAFCMNDLTEPFVTDKNLGGDGIDYHEIIQLKSEIISYLLNETGFGRLAQKLSERKRSKSHELKAQIQNTENISKKKVDDPVFQKNWKYVLTNLENIYNLAEQRNIKIVLMIFPDVFQLLNEKAKNPQKILIDHATKNNVDYIDVTEIFESLIFGNENLSVAEISQDQRLADYHDKIREYYLDHNHYTDEGHKIIAKKLMSYLMSVHEFDLHP